MQPQAGKAAVDASSWTEKGTPQCHFVLTTEQEPRMKSGCHYLWCWLDAPQQEVSWRDVPVSHVRVEGKRTQPIDSTVTAS